MPHLVILCHVGQELNLRHTDANLMQIGVFIRVLYVDRPSSVSHSLTKHHTLCIALFTDRDAGMSSPATTASSMWVFIYFISVGC